MLELCLIKMSLAHELWGTRFVLVCPRHNFEALERSLLEQLPDLKEYNAGKVCYIGYSANAAFDTLLLVL